MMAVREISTVVGLVCLAVACLAAPLTDRLNKEVPTPKTVPAQSDNAQVSADSAEDVLKELAALKPRLVSDNSHPPPAKADKPAVDFNQEAAEIGNNEESQSVVPEDSEPVSAMNQPTEIQPPQPKMEQSEQLNKEQSPIDEDLMNLVLPPKAVAEYLLVSGDFNGFDLAVADLVSSNVLSNEEAQQYKMEVSFLYEELLTRMIQAETSALQTYGNALPAPVPERPIEQKVARSSPVVPPMPVQRGMPDAPNPDLGQMMRQLQLKQMLEKEANLEELLQAIMEEYLAAYQDGQGPQDPQEEADFEALIELIRAAMNEENGDIPASMLEDSSANIASNEAPVDDEQSLSEDQDVEESVREEEDNQVAQKKEIIPKKATAEDELKALREEEVEM